VELLRDGVGCGGLLRSEWSGSRLVLVAGATRADASVKGAGAKAGAEGVGGGVVVEAARAGLLGVRDLLVERCQRVRGEYLDVGGDLRVVEVVEGASPLHEEA
jgi:hypothetical protein